MTAGTARVISLFSGLGGLDLGFKEEGFEIVWANDVSESAIETYRTNLGHTATCGDITKFAWEELPDADLIIGGPPCQSFSLMGRRDPADPNGKLVFTFLDIVRAKRPQGFVMENVPGMAASKINGVRLPDILQLQFETLGYNVIKIPLLASDYFVPQARRRLFLIGCLGRTPEIVTPETYGREVLGIDPDVFEISARAAIGNLGPCVPKGKRAVYSSQEPSAFARLMMVKGLPDCSLHECPRMSATDKLLVNAVPPGGNYLDIPDNIAPGRVLKYKQTGGRTTTYGRLHPDRPAYTINTYFRRPNVGCNFHYSEPRLITPREAMRFQSIPDHFEVVFRSQDERNALIGNAVPPLLARAVAFSLRGTLASPHATQKYVGVKPPDTVQLRLV